MDIRKANLALPRGLARLNSSDLAASHTPTPCFTSTSLLVLFPLPEVLFPEPFPTLPGQIFLFPHEVF